MRRFNINVNGKAYDVAVEELGANAAAPVAAPATAPIAAPVAAPAPVDAPVSVGAGTKVEAPMPGVILDVKAKVGDEVKPGDVIVVLEAMKMENDIVAPVAGRVSSIVVKKGDNVNSYDVMATIE